jgi:HEAT repeat protein
VNARVAVFFMSLAVVVGGCASPGGKAAGGSGRAGGGVAQLTAQTQSPDADLRREAALALGRRGLRGESAKEAREVLAALLRADSDPLVRSAAASSLGRLGGEESVPALTEGLSDRSPLVRADVCRGLGMTGAGGAVAPLAGALGLDENVDVRCGAARALGNFRELAAWRALVEALGADRQAVVTASYQALRRSTGQKKLPLEQDAWQKWLATQEDATASGSAEKR